MLSAKKNVHTLIFEKAFTVDAVFVFNETNNVPDEVSAIIA